MSEKLLLQLQMRRSRLPIRILGRAYRELLGAWWRCRLGAFGKKSYIGRCAVVTGHEGIFIGGNVAIWHSARLEAISTATGLGRLSIDDETVIQPYVHIGCALSVKIGRGCLIASSVYITDHDHALSNERDKLASRSLGLIASPVAIADNCWIGERVVVLKGVSIGSRCVVGAGSVVTRDIPPDCIVAGVPARIIRRRHGAFEGPFVQR